jgi:hypothetical protein
MFIFVKICQIKFLRFVTFVSDFSVKFNGGLNCIFFSDLRAPLMEMNLSMELQEDKKEKEDYGSLIMG